MLEKEPSVLPLESLRQEPQDPGPLVWMQELLFNQTPAQRRAQTKPSTLVNSGEPQNSPLNITASSQITTSPSSPSLRTLSPARAPGSW